MQPVLAQRELLVFSAAEAQQSRFRQSRAADAPNNQSGAAYTPGIAQPGIAHRMRYLPRTAPSLALSRTLSLEARIPSTETIIWNHPRSLDTKIRKFRIKGS
jgi:hypothetical protein